MNPFEIFYAAFVVILWLSAFVWLFPVCFVGLLWVSNKAHSWFDLFISSFTETN